MTDYSRFSPRYAGKKVLVTGAGGFLGTALVCALKSAGAEVRAVVRNRAALPQDPLWAAACSVLEGDIGDAAFWPRALEEQEIVMHLAAYEHRRGLILNPAEDFRINAGATLAMLEAATRLPAPPHIVYSSTSNIAQSTRPGQRVHEESPEAPPTLFAVHKRLSEYYLRYYGDRHSLSSVALRLANVYGPSPAAQAASRSALNIIVNHGLAGKGLSVFRNADCHRDYLFVDDAMTAFLEAGLRRGTNGAVFVVASGQDVTIRDAVTLIAREIGRVRGQEPPVREDSAAPVDALEMRNFVGDSRRFSAHAQWAPQVLLQEGLRRTVDYFNAQRSVSP